jgi:hypothetical protein
LTYARFPGKRSAPHGCRAPRPGRGDAAPPSTFEDIGRVLGISRQRANALYRQALRDIPAADLNEHRNEELTLIDDACRGLLGIASNVNVTARTRVEAYAALARWAERKARLLGLDALRGP